MSDLDADAGRALAGLDARTAQEALAEEFDETMQDEEEAAPQQAAPEGAAPAVAWSDEDRLLHRRMVEALLFAAAEPLDVETIAARLPAGADIQGALAALSADYQSRGVVLAEVAGKWRFQTAQDVAPVLEMERVEPRRLSRAALETLAIIAYHQPCTRADIEDVRGVQVSKGSLDQLLEIGWVRLRGKRRDAPGRPVLYGTTDAFLEHFGLGSVGDLPGMADLKAAGLLEARLPPGFTVPTPGDADDDENGDQDDATEAEFAHDFLEGESETGAA